MTPAQLTIEIEAAMNRVIEAQSEKVTRAVVRAGSKEIIDAASRMLAMLEMKEAISEVLHNIQPTNQTTTTSV